jgi:hypothetical protein
MTITPRNNPITAAPPPSGTSPIYLGTVLLEANRWAKDRTPTYRVSEWLERIAAAGFDGIELWENHATLADCAERSALRGSTVPIRVFNSYVPLDAGGENARRTVAGLVRELNAGAVKFNVSNSPETLESGRLRAGLDVLAGPDRLPSGHPARQWQNLIWTCHDIERDWPTDGEPPKKLHAMHEICLDNLRRFRDGQPLRFTMDRRRFDLSS